MKPYKLSIFALLIFCSSISSYSYTIESKNNMDIINTNLSIKIDRLSNLKSKVTIQSFPQNNMGIENYKLVFDMKFRDDYDSDFAGVCIGPAWENYGPGEFTIYLKASNNYKNDIIGDHQLLEDDGCQNYFYYLRYFEVTTLQQNKYLVGVATDYAEEYPDAPYVWKQNNFNVIEEIGNSNIEKYSIYFELSR